MIVKDLPESTLAKLLSSTGIGLYTGAFQTHIKTDVGDLIGQIAQLYGEFPVETEDSICDFFIRISSPSKLRSVFRPQVSAYIGDEDPFEPMPRDLAMPLFESALNWCVASRTNRYLLLHAGVVAKDGHAAIFPAPSGSGKSTLSAYLSLAGWRLLSDEFGIVDPESGALLANPRPISLKNESIEHLIRNGGADYLSRSFEGTTKGTIAYLRPFGASTRDLARPCIPALVVFPSFERGAALSIEAVDKPKAHHWIVQNAVNYLLHGQDGFDAISRIVDQCAIYTLRYSNYLEALDALSELFAAQSTKAKSVVAYAR